MKKTILTAIFSLSVCGAVFAEDEVANVAVETHEVAIADAAEVSQTARCASVLIPTPAAYE